MSMLDGEGSDGKDEMRTLCTEISIIVAELPVKTLVFGHRDNLQRMVDLGGGEFLPAIHGVELKELESKASASLVKMHFR
mmetsp:Transcript_84306/g.136665  ORF Transcript_84306/g.136665 Transcript_84306/m.136665 type:complete len:80 (-) Transcript_84306:284-523(-)